MIIENSEIKNTEKDFLDSGNPLAKGNIHLQEIPHQGNTNTAINNDRIQVREDIKNLTKTELKDKYSLTYKSWDNMKQRCKNGKGVLSQEFESFHDFLGHVGPRKHSKYTLDRIDNDNPRYAPDNVEWRDKYAQNSNRSNNTILVHDNGESRTIAQWARITGQNPSTLYKRKQQGWDDMEIITGERDKELMSILDSTPWPYDRREIWEKKYQQKIFSSSYVSRMDFLHGKAKKWLNTLDHEECEVIRDKADEGDIEALKKIEYLVDKYNRFEEIVHQTSQQLNYDTSLKKYLKITENSKHNEQALFKAVHPRPPYTLNKKTVPD